ncbi:YqgQ family protein [Staphylococcus sp. SQ8-PEA]|uniref:YqgQ family protein n=1 Tax=Staphylococcus marylandisciuri TaxID=2981529 RepID=A0ABT2QQZ3_9STAP|nr:YqgQ family protein [Staphylococcus marylandisciuri]MCU5746367.1 YqgQ family protein [Staphylococcus marylandisciuri]
MNYKINDFYDVLQLLKQFGCIIYFKDPLDRLEMIEQEINSLYHYELISKDEYLKCKVIISQKRK